MSTWQTAGKVRMTPAGVHDPTNTYEVLDLVSNSTQDTYYIAKQDVPANVQVTNTTYWAVVVDLSGCLPDFLSSIAPDYDDMTFPIAKGSLVIHEDELYLSNIDINTSEDWNSSHWDETTVADQIKTISPLEGGNSAGSVQTKSFIRNNNTIEQTASGIGSFAEGYDTVASGLASHAEGESTNAIGDDSHSEGLRTATKGNYSHAEGNGVITIGNSSHIEGSSTNINCRITGAENATTYTVSNASSSISGVILGSPILVRSINKVAIISAVDKANNTITVSSTFGVALNSEKAIIFKAYASGAYSHVEGMSNIADDQASHAEGNGTMAIGTAAHSEGISTKSINSGTHSEGTSTIAKGYYSHAENYYTIAYGENSHVENQGETYSLTVSGSAESTTYTYTNNNRDPAVGDSVRKNQYCSRVTAVDTVNKTFTVDTTLHYQFSSEGLLFYCSGAFGKNSHAEGKGTTALGTEQHVQGRYNIPDADNTYAEIVGNGTAHNARSNARVLDWSGNEALAGGITLGMGTADEVTLSASDMKDMVADVGDLKTDLYGESVDTSGGLLVNGYYIKNNKQVTSSANFNTYKYALSGVKYVEITTYGYNSTASVASDSDYDASSFPGKTFTTGDKMIYPSATISSISAWTEKAIVDGYDYLYVSCYKNNTPVVMFYNGNGVLPVTVKNEEDIVGIKADALSAMYSYTSLLNTADKWTLFGNDANNLAPNMVYCITYSSGISNLPYSGFNGFIKSYMAYYGNNTVWMQTATNSTGKRNFSRVLWSGTWTEWQELALASDLSLYGNDIHTLFYENDLWKVFHTVDVIGDSLASGESASNEGGSTQYHDLYPFSWGQCMARDSGNTYYNFSKGGLTTKTWMTDPDYGYTLASQEGKLCDMYIIGLGQNDAASSMTVGSSSDINMSDPDQNGDTFYGNYGKIIQKIKALAPKAPIFVCSRPTVPASNAYETAIRSMPTIFENVYLIDLYKHVYDFYDANSIIRKSLRSGHYNAVAYQVISKHIEEEISAVMRANIDDFMQVEFINTEYSWTD